MICVRERWKIPDIRRLYDPTSSVYQRALLRGMPEGHTREIATDLQSFKPTYREVFRPGRIIAGLGLRARGGGHQNHGGGHQNQLPGGFLHEDA